LYPTINTEIIVYKKEDDIYACVVALPFAQQFAQPLRTGSKSLIMIKSPPAAYPFEALENIYLETQAELAKRFDNQGFWCSELDIKNQVARA
jgi:hypothetical protein